MHSCVLTKIEMDDLDIIYFLRDAQWCKLKHCYLFLMSKSICSQFYLILFLVEGEMWSPTRWPLGPGCLSINVFAHSYSNPYQIGWNNNQWVFFFFFFGLKFCNLVRKIRDPCNNYKGFILGKNGSLVATFGEILLWMIAKLTYLINFGKINTDNFRHLPYAMHYSYLSIESRLYKVLCNVGCYSIHLLYMFMISKLK
jgi:hypothetical protein